MPELADVEGWRRYVARYARGRRVRRVRTRDAEVLRNTTPQGLGRALKGGRIGAPERHGKWLPVPVGAGRLMLHFGMTGALSWTTKPTEHPPDDADHVIFVLEGAELRYRAPRKLGGVWWLPADAPLAAVTGPLGPDAARISREGFRERLRGRRGGVKAALMDQSLLAGIGNELSDEILWRAGLRPRTPVAALDRADTDALHRAMHRVLRETMRHGRIPVRGRWLGAVRGHETPECPRCGTRLRHTKAAGRTAWWCPACQPRR